MKHSLSLLPSTEREPRRQDELATKTPIFGLRYLEEEDTDIYDVVGGVGCMQVGASSLSTSGASIVRSGGSCGDVDYDYEQQ
jgi:hypothetical protein